MTDNTPTTKQEEGGLNLLGCPLCGTGPSADHEAIQVQGYRNAGTDEWQVLCEHCGATSGNRETLAAAVEHWNTRAPATPPHNEDGVRKLAERLHQAADDIVSGETIFSDRVHGLLWEAADALSRQALGDIPSG